MNNVWVATISAVTMVVSFYNDELALCLSSAFFLGTSLISSFKWAYDDKQKKSEGSRNAHAQNK